jgi:predicted metal-dependent phosphoesterase TrpH
MAAVGPATDAAARLGITVVSGIEITSVHRGKDVHILAYFLSETAPGLQQMLAAQRRQRVERAQEIGDRLARLGVPIEVSALVAAASAPGGKAIARPQIAQALVAAGHVATVADAFDHYLGEESPAYVAHRGASPAEVVELISGGGGLASLAHPGYRPQDDIIGGLVDAGLAAIEVFHSSHDSATESHYLAIAERHSLLVTGGSDYHGEGTRRAEFFGVTNLPAEHFARMSAYVERAVQTPSATG